MATLGLSKVFILDKYFTELQKFWETERKLQDVSSSNEAVHLQQRLRHLSSELVTLRSRLHVNGSDGGQPQGVGQGKEGSAGQVDHEDSNNNNNDPSPQNNSNNTSNNSSTGATYQNQSSIFTSSSAGSKGPGVPQGLAHRQPSNIPRPSSVAGPGPPYEEPDDDLPADIVDAAAHRSATSHHQSMSFAVPSPLSAFAPPGDGNPHGGGGPPSGSFHSHQASTSVRAIPASSSLPSSLPPSHPPPPIPNNPPPSLLRNTLPRHQAPPPASSKRKPHPHDTPSADASAPAVVGDLIHLPSPVAEEGVLRTLQERFSMGKYFTNVGPILLAVNPYHHVGLPLTLNAIKTSPSSSGDLFRVVKEAARLQSETGYPQAIILSGVSGSGKTYASMQLLRHLFDVAGGGPETDAFKHLAAAFTVLRSLGSAKTQSNSESSRIGHFIEVQVTEGALYRTKIHCYFLDQSRVVRPLPREKNYHIFYQLLAGLSTDERSKLHLDGLSVLNLRYLSCGDITQTTAEDARRFEAWKSCLGVLGIPFLDVVRVLAAVLLLGNVDFLEGTGSNEIVASPELQSVASLLGVTDVAMFHGLASRAHTVRSGGIVQTACDAQTAFATRDALAKALYCRTVSTIVRRANSLRRIGSASGTLSSDSNESVHKLEVSSQHASTVGTMGSKASKSMNVLNSAVRHATDGFLGILDMFGFEDPMPSQLEHLCINLCAETMQHFYNTHIFKSSVESCRDEGISCDIEVDYVDNVPCIDLISSLRTGLLSLLDAECTTRGTSESYLQNVSTKHENSRLFEIVDQRTFMIKHFVGKVTYDATKFIETNRDVLPDNLVAVFHKQTCNFGFATHLFGSELKALFNHPEAVPRGANYRISPTSQNDMQNGDEPVTTLTQDFHTRLDNLLRTLVHAKPHFIRCIRANSCEDRGRFDRHVVGRQIRAMQVMETVNLMAGGFPHRMRFKAFNSRYKLLAPFRSLRRSEDHILDDAKLILTSFSQRIEEQPINHSVSINWALGKRHLFLSEGARQMLEYLRSATREESATLIQASWRGWKTRAKLLPAIKAGVLLQKSHPGVAFETASHSLRSSSRRAQILRSPLAGTTASVLPLGLPGYRQPAAPSSSRPRPQPIAGTPPPNEIGIGQINRCDPKTIQRTCQRFGLDVEQPPPLPPSRTYTVAGNAKLSYPQMRVMKATYPDDGSASDIILYKGESVLVIGAGKRGHLVVEHKGIAIQVPFQYLELRIDR